MDNTSRDASDTPAIGSTASSSNSSEIPWVIEESWDNPNKWAKDIKDLPANTTVVKVKGRFDVFIDDKDIPELCPKESWH
jgi:hypothetical protein